MRPSRLLSLAVAVVVVLVVGTAVAVVVSRDGSGSADPAAGRTGRTGPTTLADLARADLVVRRASFCERVGSGPVRKVLGTEPSSSVVYDNGEDIPATDTSDVAHEYGCTWTSSSGGVASAWVFAPPVSAGRATRLNRLATRAAGCARVEGETFGDPGVATRCTDAAGTSVTSSRQGLFGDAWLTCQVRAPTAEATGAAEQLDPWCVAVAVAASE